MGLLLLFLFGAMGVSFLCSVLESVLMSTSLSYINLREEEGYRPAKLMSKYKDDTSRPLAAILSLNTIANTIGAAGVGMQVVALGYGKWFGLVSALTTILILFFGEIIPKVIGTTYWRELMGFTARCGSSNSSPAWFRTTKTNHLSAARKCSPWLIWAKKKE